MYKFLENKRTRVAAGFLAAFVALLIIYYLRTIFIPLFISVMLAYIFNPVIVWFEKKRVNRTLAITFLFVIGLSLLVLTIGIGGPAIINQGKDLLMVIAGDEYKDVNQNGIFDTGDELLNDRNLDGEYTQSLILKFSDWLTASSLELTGRFTKNEAIQNNIKTQLMGIEDVFKEQTDTLSTNLITSFNKFIGNTFAIITYLAGFLLVPIYTFFLMREMENLKQKVGKLLPGRSREKIQRIVKKIDLAVSAFFRGRFIVCTICSIITWVGLMVIGVEYSFLFGVLIGTATVVPFLGLAFLGPAVLVAYLGPGGSVGAVVWTVLLYFFVQALEGSFLTPVILGKEVELHPVFLILAFLICGKVLGFVGVLLAVPIASIVKILTAEFVMPSVEEIAAEQNTTMMKKIESKSEALETQENE